MYVFPAFSTNAAQVFELVEDGRFDSLRRIRDFSPKNIREVLSGRLWFVRHLVAETEVA